MSQQWFVRSGNQEKGPFTIRQLIRMCRVGTVGPTDLIRTPRSRSRNNWRHAIEIKGIFGDPELMQEAQQLAGDEPFHPDNQADQRENVRRICEDLLAETIESDIETDLYEESFPDREERDALLGRRNSLVATRKNSRSNVQTDNDSSKESATSLGKSETTQVGDELDNLPPPHKPVEGISTGSSTGNAAWVPDAEDRMLWEAFHGLPYGADSVPLIDSETPPLAHRTINDQSEFKIAHRFITGSVVEDHAKGMEILLALAEKGHTDSQRLLGLILWFGTIVPKNCESASKWFRKAADAGDGWSMQRLGVMLLNGDGIERNETEAFRWFQLAANLGIDEAMNCLAMCFLRGRGTAKDGDKAIHWLKVASELECEVAQYNLGRRYFLGEFVERDYEKALSLFKLASRWDDKEATPSEWYIYCCYKEGCGTVPDLKTAVEWLQKGANRECSMSMAELGRMHMRGECVDRDFSKGTQLLRKAAIAGDAHAQFHLGIAYQNGDGVPRDEGESIRWFYLASKNRSKDTDGFVLGNELAVSHLWDMISPLISDRLRFILG